MTLLIVKKHYQRGLLLILFFGISICVWQLGSTGLVDETPPLFAASSRAMSSTGDWLTPRVNGLPRFDKPPLIYWLMGFFYSLPGQATWDPLGTWSARLPSALSTVLMMLFLGDTFMRWSPREVVFPRRAAFITALAFGLSPLVVIWSRIAVSDALLCSTLGISLILTWRSYVNPSKQAWVWGWIFLGLAILTKGPVSIVITLLSFLLFGFSENNFSLLYKRIKPIKGTLIALFISMPCYILELIKEGKPFWDSFFGYHNFQRLTSVVNSHSEPWWFFGFILIVASLPFTPFLILGIWDFLYSTFNFKKRNLPEDSLLSFAACWLISILLLFTFAATKLPSYWLPATPAAAILIGITASTLERGGFRSFFSLFVTSRTALIFSLALFSIHSWIYLINDPEIPNLSSTIVASGIYLPGAILLLLSAFLGIYLIKTSHARNIILIQIPLLFFQIFFMLPLWKISDNLRQLPIRRVSQLIDSSRKENEPIAMVGINKPSLHFYTNQIIIYENASQTGVINLAERLDLDIRNNFDKRTNTSIAKTVLIVIDEKTSKNYFLTGLKPQFLGKFSIYNVWRIDKNKLDKRAKDIMDSGIKSNWREPNPERI